MKNMNHTFTELFKQLGLPNDAISIDTFLKLRHPLAADKRVEDAPFWSFSQRHFLKEKLTCDGDWSELIDRLSVALRQEPIS
jgi:Protein of unknown function (DUF2789)